jgi:hypothetical protein
VRPAHNIVAQVSLDAAGDFIRRNSPALGHRAHTAQLQETGGLHLARGADRSESGVVRCRHPTAGRQVRDLGSSLLQQAKVEDAAGRSDDARRAAERALGQFEPAIDADHPLTRKVRARAGW